MKLKRIISTALTVIMLFTTLVAVIPVNSGAAHSPSSVVSESTMSLEEIQSFVRETYLKYKFNTAEEMLKAELDAGYLDYATTANGLFSMYVNRYTGFFYYRNNYTGQILTSNPIDPGLGKTPQAGASETDLQTPSAEKIMGQIDIKLVDASNTTNSYEYNSIDWAALYGQISVTAIEGGLSLQRSLRRTSLALSLQSTRRR